MGCFWTGPAPGPWWNGSSGGSCAGAHGTRGATALRVGGPSGGGAGRRAPARGPPPAGEPVPEHLGALGELVRRGKADLGMAVDPDVDRLALVDERGETIAGAHPLAS